MDNILNNKGEELNAQFDIDIIDNQLGLILNSRGQKRNSDYNPALELILKRLKDANISNVIIKIVSRNLLANMPNPLDRTIKLNGKSVISLRVENMNQLRKEIGKEIAQLKMDKTTAGGNSTKRIQLVSDLLDKKKWRKIAFGNLIAMK